MSLSQQVAQLEEDLRQVKALNNRLQTRVAELEAIVGVSSPILIKHGIVGSRRIILMLLMAHPMVTRDMMFSALYERVGKDPASNKTIDVMLSKLRRQVPRGMTIENEYDTGWFIPAEQKQLLRT